MINLNTYIAEDFKINKDIKLDKNIQSNKIYLVVLEWRNPIKNKKIDRPDDCCICYNIKEIQELLEDRDFSSSLIKMAIKEISLLDENECIKYKSKDGYMCFISCFNI